MFKSHEEKEQIAREKQFAFRYNIEFKDFELLPEDDKRLILVSNGLIELNDEQENMLAFCLIGCDAETLPSDLLPILFDHDVDDDTIPLLFGSWIAELTDHLNREAEEIGNLFSRNLRQFGANEFPVDIEEFMAFLNERCDVSAEGMSTSDKWRAREYADLLIEAEDTLHLLVETVNTHNEMISARM